MEYNGYIYPSGELVVGISILINLPSVTDNFRFHSDKILLIHGRHIYHNLDNQGGFTNNHYLADLVGLVYLGFFARNSWKRQAG